MVDIGLWIKMVGSERTNNGLIKFLKKKKKKRNGI